MMIDYCLDFLTAQGDFPFVDIENHHGDLFDLIDRGGLLRPGPSISQ